jgi:hypothetical protein
VGVLWSFKIFTFTSHGIVVGIHILLGLSLASWSCLFTIPFGKSPRSAAIVCVICCFIAVIVTTFTVNDAFKGDVIPFIISFLVPPTFYVLSLTAITQFEEIQQPALVSQPDPTFNIRLSAPIGGAIVRIHSSHFGLELMLIGCHVRLAYSHGFLGALDLRSLVPFEKQGGCPSTWICHLHKEFGPHFRHILLHAQESDSHRGAESRYSTRRYHRPSWTQRVCTSAVPIILLTEFQSRKVDSHIHLGWFGQP